MTARTGFKTPLGFAILEGDENGLSRVYVSDKKMSFSEVIPAPILQAENQLKEYFFGKRETFDLKINPEGTSFQKKVWELLMHIPFGNTRSYLELSNDFGNTKAIRAVAAANGKNPLWIIIPCHRVIGSNGSLTGYAGGLWRKKWLLEHEQPLKQQSLF